MRMYLNFDNESAGFFIKEIQKPKLSLQISFRKNHGTVWFKRRS
jgi:hypothetical protein